ncbi:MAG: saccharopine dehydrogenase NADP-binding domain-containing protein [Gemmatimonadales bacterium]|jgi:lysine 6-dehydrogenase|nr:MAG: saccharopine dehydrogenase NADP-binding domain-containing protein [Gemmatimonadales bacterium]
MKFLILGGGAQGSAAAFDLVRRDSVERVVVADAKPGNPRPFLRPWLGGKLDFVHLDAQDHGAVREVMEEVDAVVCGLPYFFNLPMTELAVESGCHYCDLGGNTEIVEHQKTLHAEARDRGLSVIPDCGLAPGMVNILAQAGIDEMDQTRSVKIRVGGLPQNPKPPLNYQIVYSMHGVLDYYTTLSIALEDGRVVKKEALSEVEPVVFDEPVGELEAFHTAGGISTMPYRYQGKIPHMEYKTLRYPGHAHIMWAIRELGLLSLEPVQSGGQTVVPRDVFIDVVSPRLRNPEGNDLVALRVKVAGETDGKERTVTYDLLDYYDAENRITAMMRTTGYSLAITSLMQADGRVEKKGVHTPDEAMPAEPYIAELAKHGIDIRRTVS